MHTHDFDYRNNNVPPPAKLMLVVLTISNRNSITLARRERRTAFLEDIVRNTGTTQQQMWLTPTEAAGELRVAHKKILFWIHNGQLVASNFGLGASPRFKIHRDELDKFAKRLEWRLKD